MGGYGVCVVDKARVVLISLSFLFFFFPFSLLVLVRYVGRKLGRKSLSVAVESLLELLQLCSFN